MNPMHDQDTERLRRAVRFIYPGDRKLRFVGGADQSLPATDVMCGDGSHLQANRLAAHHMFVGSEWFVVFAGECSGCGTILYAVGVGHSGA